MTAKILFVIGILILGGVAIKLITTLSSKEDIIKLVVPIMFAVIILLVSMNWQYILKYKKSSDYTILHRPYLDPIITITKSQEDNFSYEFLVSNLGKLPARNIISVTTSPVFSSAEIEPPLPRELVSGAKMVLRLKSGPLEFTKNKTLLIDLFLLYDTDIDGEIHQYKSTFRYEFSLDSVANGNYVYVSSQHGEGTLSERQQIDLASAKNIDGEEGTLYFEFNVSKQNIVFNSIIIRSKKHNMLYTPIGREIYWFFKNNTGKTYLLKTKLKKPSDIHKIAITWSINRISMALDGDITNLAILKEIDSRG